MARSAAEIPVFIARQAPPSSSPTAPARAERQPSPFKVVAFNLVMPGSGTIHARRDGEGSLQVFLFIVGVLTSPFLIGLAIAAGAWTWSQISTFELLSRKTRA